jgi:glycerol-3-phosphate acyltransferase PlsX
MDRPVVIDATGSDTAPVPEILGAVEARSRFGIDVVLSGNHEALDRAMERLGCAGAVGVLDAPETIEPEDQPIEALRRKPASSMRMALEALRSRECDAVVSAGNSGALVVIATAVLGRIPGVERPALAVELPSLAGPVLFTDAGANSDCRPSHLLSFARLAERVARRMFGLSEPRIGLLCNGVELGKGNELVKASAALLETSGMNFVGRVEPHSLVDGPVDVAVTDGFNGNLVLKTMEGTARLVHTLLRRAFRESFLPAVGYSLARSALRRHVQTTIDYRERGGAPLLGVNGVVLAAHGRSGPRAIANAVRRAAAFAGSNVTASLLPVTSLREVARDPGRLRRARAHIHRVEASDRR